MLRTADELQLRGTDAGAPCVILRRGTAVAVRRRRVQGAATRPTCFGWPTATGTTTRPLPETIGGMAVDLVDPSGIPVHVVAGTHELAALPPQSPHTFNFGHELRRVNATQRPPRVPARVQRLGPCGAADHQVHRGAQLVPRQPRDDRQRLPVLSRPARPRADDELHPLRPRHRPRPTTTRWRWRWGRRTATFIRPIRSAISTRWPPAANTSRDRGYFRSWGIGRHIQGSQLFDYWRDPDGFMVEHFSDGDMFDSTLEPGWAPFTASGLAQWGPPVTKDFLGTSPKSASPRSAVDDHRAARRQRIRYQPPHRPPESSQLMTISILRTNDAWWVQTPTGAAKITTTAATTGELLADRAAIDAAAHSADTVPVDSLDLVSPVTAPCRVVAQMTNFASHVKDAGMDPKSIPLTFFRKASASISGPFDEIVKPDHVRFLDYEVEIGLVIGRDIPVGTTITEANLSDYIAGLVVTNDVSARDIQLPQTQFYEAKSYPTFTPVGPALVLLDADELKRFGDLRLRLRVSGEVRQDMLVDGDMIYRPVQALQALSRFQRLDAGDLVMTGTPVGTALSAPPKPVEIIGSLLPPAVKWKAFFKRAAKNHKYLQHGDVVEATVATDDGAIDLGTQRTAVKYA